MPLMRRGDQRRFLTFDDEQKQLAELDEIYEREAAWRLEQSHLALARWQALRAGQRGGASRQDRASSAIPATAKTLEQRATEMLLKLRLTPALVWGR